MPLCTRFLAFETDSLMNYIVQVFIPLEEDGQPGAQKHDLAVVEREMVEKFGGVTAFIHHPAIGIWKDPPGKTVKDKVVIFEVMTATVDRSWWNDYKRMLQSRLRQEEILIRALPTVKL